MQIPYLNRNSYQTLTPTRSTSLMNTTQTRVRTYSIVNTSQIQVTSVGKSFHSITIINVNMALAINRVIVDVAINLNKAKISKKPIMRHVVLNVIHFLLRIGVSIIVCIIVLLMPFTIRSVDVDLTAMPNVFFNSL